MEHIKYILYVQEVATYYIKWVTTSWTHSSVEGMTLTPPEWTPPPLASGYKLTFTVTSHNYTWLLTKCSYSFLYSTYCMSKKSWPILGSKLLNKMCQDWDIQLVLNKPYYILNYIHKLKLNRKLDFIYGRLRFMKLILISIIFDMGNACTLLS